MTKEQLHRGVLVINKHAEKIGIIINVDPTDYKSYEVLWFLHCGRMPRYQRYQRNTKYSFQSFLNAGIYTLTGFCEEQKEEHLNER
jgi:hypothetical protein